MPSAQRSVQHNAVSVEKGLQGGGEMGFPFQLWRRCKVLKLLSPQAIGKSRIRAELMAQSGDREQCCPVWLQDWVLATCSFTALLLRLARAIMTASLLRRLCQQFEMTLILCACKLFCTEHQEMKNISEEFDHNTITLPQAFDGTTFHQQRYMKSLTEN